jgi:PAS domain-containing protein
VDGAAEVVVAHVELSLSEALVPPARTPTSHTGSAGPHLGHRPGPPQDTLSRWAVAVAAAAEPCLLIDARSRIVASSAAYRELLGLADPAAAAGRPLLDTLQLIDFTAAPSPLDEVDADKIPPLLALNSGRLARGLLRVGPAGAGEPPGTLDAITTPLLEGGAVVGSLTFLSAI